MISIITPFAHVNQAAEDLKTSFINFIAPNLEETHLS